MPAAGAANPMNRDSDNPYAVSFDEAVARLPPGYAHYARNIRAICTLYLLVGGIAGMFGFAMFVTNNAAVGLVASVMAAVTIIGAMGVLSRCAWGVSWCQVVSILFLLWIPIGTVLGFYFLKHIGKVSEAFR